MDIMERIKSLFAKHTELGRQHQELGKSLSDLKREATQVQETVDRALEDFQSFALKVKKSRSNGHDHTPKPVNSKVRTKRVR